MVSFQDSLIYALYDNNPMMKRATIAEIEGVNYDRVMQIWKERIADPVSYTHLDVYKRQGSIIAGESGTAFAYALNNLQSRGRFFIAPQEEVYAGQVIGERCV